MRVRSWGVSRARWSSHDTATHCILRDLLAFIGGGYASSDRLQVFSSIGETQRSVLILRRNKRRLRSCSA